MNRKSTLTVISKEKEILACSLSHTLELCELAIELSIVAILFV